MESERPTVIRPGLFGLDVAADSRRGIYDYHNEALLAERTPVGTVFIGDSITEMWAVQAFFRGASKMLINRGIGGDRTPFVRRRFEADALQLRPDLIVMMIGVNNTWDLDYPWDPDVYRPAEEIEEEIVSDVEAMAGATSTRGVDLALCSVLPTDVPLKATNAVRNELIARVNTRLQEVASRHGAIYVDYHGRMAADDGKSLRAGLADDGLHPHVLGYRIMARALLDALRSSGVQVVEALAGA